MSDNQYYVNFGRGTFWVQPAPRATDTAAALTKAVEKLPYKRVNIIAHSMGGLDARYAISHLGLGSRVTSLTTIGTPHRGTPVADLAGPLAGVLGKVGLPAIGDLTTEGTRELNLSMRWTWRLRWGVKIGCVVARASDPAHVSPLLRPTWRLLTEKVGDNDGLVPVSSQRFGRVLGRIETDHWGEIGWAVNAFDTPAVYEQLVRRLRRRGC